MKKNPKIIKKEKSIIKYELSHFDLMLLALIGLVGSVMFWKGTIMMIEKVDFLMMNPPILLLIGLLFLFLAGMLIKGQTK